jgi:hypothetical protein
MGSPEADESVDIEESMRNDISIISSRLPGRRVIFAINPDIPLASFESASTGVSATAPMYSKNVRRSISTRQV